MCPLWHHKGLWARTEWFRTHFLKSGASKRSKGWTFSHYRGLHQERNNWVKDRDNFSNNIFFYFCTLKRFISALFCVLFFCSLVSLWPGAQPPVGSIPQRERMKREGSDEKKRKGTNRRNEGGEKGTIAFSLYRVMLRQLRRPRCRERGAIFPPYSLSLSSLLPILS